MSQHIEIEHKFLIKKPDLDWLINNSHEVLEIEQTYLNPKIPGSNLRVRKVPSSRGVSFIQTEKERISPLSCIEREKEVTEEEYKYLLQNKREDSDTIFKTRYKMNYFFHILEIDIYTFFGNYATLEIELKSEGESFKIPEEIEVLAEVSDISIFKNTKLARWIKTNPGKTFPAIEYLKEKGK